MTSNNSIKLVCFLSETILDKSLVLVCNNPDDTSTRHLASIGKRKEFKVYTTMKYEPEDIVPGFNYELTVRPVKYKFIDASRQVYGSKLMLEDIIRL